MRCGQNSVSPDVSTLLNEEVFSKIVSLIASLFPVLNCLVREQMSKPNFVPDIVISRNWIDRGTWSEAFWLVELDTSRAKIEEPIPKWIEHCYAEHKNLNIESNGIYFRVGIASNLKSLMVFHLPKNLLEMKQTSVLSLFPNGWREMDEPTEGFKMLCHTLDFWLLFTRYVFFSCGGEKIAKKLSITKAKI